MTGVNECRRCGFVRGNAQGLAQEMNLGFKEIQESLFATALRSL